MTTRILRKQSDVSKNILFKKKEVSPKMIYNNRSHILSLCGIFCSQPHFLVNDLALWVKALAAESENLSLIPGTHSSKKRT